MIYVKKEEPTEAMICFDLCLILKQKNIEFDLQYSPKGSLYGGDRSIFDIVIIKDNKIRIIIEVKKSLTKEDWEKSEQYLKYSKFGEPLLLYSGIYPIEKVLANIEDILSKPYQNKNEYDEVCIYNKEFLKIKKEKDKEEFLMLRRNHIRQREKEQQEVSKTKQFWRQHYKIDYELVKKQDIKKKEQKELKFKKQELKDIRLKNLPLVIYNKLKEKNK